MRVVPVGKARFRSNHRRGRIKSKKRARDSMTKTNHDADVAFIEALAKLLRENDLTELQVKREYDNAETVAARLDAYHAQTAPLIAFYDAQGALARVDAMGAIDEIATTLGDIVRRATA
jgi:adenylate kinase family enzyme